MIATIAKEIASLELLQASMAIDVHTTMHYKNSWFFQLFKLINMSILINILVDLSKGN
jgi:hypothetical protein